MKLLQRTGYYYLIFSLMVFLLGALVMFLALRLVLDYETDEGLRHTSKVVKQYLMDLDTLPDRLKIMDEVVELQLAPTATEVEVFSDTSFFDPEEQEYEPYRKFTFLDSIRGQNYLVSINHSRVESQDLITTILLVNLGILSLLLVSLNQVNRFLSRQLWRPFYQTIQQIQGFSIQDNEKLELSHTQTEEFDQLNRSLERMTEKLQRDYRSLRRFTENASHEMQTPLAIMRNQVDLLLQNADRPAADFASISHLSEAISRLRRLNSALLLLTKIENEQYQNTERVQLLPLLEQKLAALQPLLEERNINLQTELSELTLDIHPVLADVLLNNLLENAIKHNLPNGQIGIFLGNGKLRITNTGAPLSTPPAELFERFAKESTKQQSLGLGLAIVREICTLYGWSVHYDIQQGEHQMEVSFHAQ
ncbi:sensor histidine kinase [Flavilitoribacter nigricans]|nr:HAMP domain-containing sensor histidine kinase [Flavilitoribacter nigricans]